MKLLICRRGWSASGGAERFLQRFAGGLAATGIDPILVADSRWPAEAWPIGGVIERTTTTDPLRFASEVLRIKERYPDSRLFSMERLPGSDVFRAGDGLHSAWLSRLAAEDGRLNDWFRRHRKMHRQILDLETRLFSDPKLRVVANSRMVACELMEHYEFPDDRICVVPNGYDPLDLEEGESLERRELLRARLGIPHDAVVFLFVGSGWKRKGAQILIDAFRLFNHPNSWLLLVGKGKANGMMHPRIHQAGAQINPVNWYLSSDVFVLPTLYDPFSNACLEAAVYGLPVITSDANGFREVIDIYPDAGEVVPIPSHTGPWCEALNRWMSCAMRDRAKPHLLSIRRHFTVARNVAATVEFMGKAFAP
jgi:UDP-glucose:(heptosyl)LPS alpha-1,3-glucosyltransferase